jgi:hypothetical protein
MIGQTFFLYVYEPGGNRIEIAAWHGFSSMRKGAWDCCLPRFKYKLKFIFS